MSNNDLSALCVLLLFLFLMFSFSVGACIYTVQNAEAQGVGVSYWDIDSDESSKPASYHQWPPGVRSYLGPTATPEPTLRVPEPTVTPEPTPTVQPTPTVTPEPTCAPEHYHGKFLRVCVDGAWHDAGKLSYEKQMEYNCNVAKEAWSKNWREYCDAR